MDLQQRSRILLNLLVIGLFIGIPISYFAQTEAKQKLSIDVQKTIGQLKSKNAEQRGFAACELGEAKAEAAISNLVDLLGDSTAIDMVTCGERGKFAKYEPAKSSSPGMEAARSLGAIAKSAIDNSNVIDPLIKVLYENDVDARRNAVLAFGIIQDKKTLKPLLSVLKDDSSKVREKTVWALASLKESCGAVIPLIGSLSDENADVRERAAWALGTIGDERAVKSLMLATQDEAASVRERAAWALGTIKAKIAVNFLIIALKDESANVRERAAWALGVIKDVKALDGLKIAANDRDSKVRKHASEAINLIKREYNN